MACNVNLDKDVNLTTDGLSSTVCASNPRKTPTRYRVLAHLSLLFNTVTFSVWNVASRRLMTAVDMPPIVLAGCRDVLALPLLLVAVWLGATRCAGDDEGGPPTSRGDILRLVWLGLVGPFGAQALELVAIFFLDAHVGALFPTISPIITLLVGASPMFGLEVLSCSRVFGVVLGVSGGLLVIFMPASGSGSGTFGFSPQRLIGFAFGFSAALAQSLYFLQQKPLYGRVSIQWQILLIFASAGVFSAMASVPYWIQAGGIPMAHGSITANTGAWLLYGALVCSALNWLLMAWSNKYMPASTMALYGILQPPFTDALAFAWLGERCGPQDAVCAVFVAIGLWLCSTDRPRNSRARVAVPDGSCCDLAQSLQSPRRTPIQVV